LLDEDIFSYIILVYPDSFIPAVWGYWGLYCLG